MAQISTHNDISQTTQANVSKMAVEISNINKKLDTFQPANRDDAINTMNAKWETNNVLLKALQSKGVEATLSVNSQLRLNRIEQDMANLQKGQTGLLEQIKMGPTTAGSPLSQQISAQNERIRKI